MKSHRRPGPVSATRAIRRRPTISDATETAAAVTGPAEQCRAAAARTGYPVLRFKRRLCYRPNLTPWASGRSAE